MLSLNLPISLPSHFRLYSHPEDVTTPLPAGLFGSFESCQPEIL